MCVGADSVNIQKHTDGTSATVEATSQQAVTERCLQMLRAKPLWQLHWTRPCAPPDALCSSSPTGSLL